MKANLSDFSVGEKIILDIYTDMDWVVCDEWKDAT